MEIKIIPKEDFDQFCNIEQAAYAGNFKGTKEEREKLDVIFKELTDNDIKAIGAYEGRTMIGSVLYYEFETNFHQKMIRTAGIGSLAVDLLHKKKHVANELINYTFNLARKSGADLYHLFPFSTEFYRNFGFGYGSPMFTYCIAPKDFMATGDKSILSYGSESDYKAAFKLHDELAKVTHGMNIKTYGDKRRIRRMDIGKLVLAKKDGALIGYMIYTQSGISTINDQAQKLNVVEMIYSDPSAVKSFASFFNSQKDQIDYIEIALHDNHFQHLTNNTCFVPEPKTLEIISLKVADKSMGLMPYAIEPQKLLDRLSLDIDIELNIAIKVPRGVDQLVSIGQGKKVDVSLSINEFSSWITGVITLNKLYELGQLETSQPNSLKTIDKTFYFDSPKSFSRY